MSNKTAIGEQVQEALGKIQLAMVENMLGSQGNTEDRLSEAFDILGGVLKGLANEEKE